MIKTCCFILLVSLVNLGPLCAQSQKISHELFGVDSARVLHFQLHDHYEPVVWSGSQVMVKTTVRLYGGSDGILQHFLDEGRYAILLDSLSDQYNLVSKDAERRPIKTSKGECFEVVELVVYIPDRFAKTEDHTWTKISEPDEN